VSLHHQWKGPGGVKESVRGDQLHRVYWKRDSAVFKMACRPFSAGLVIISSYAYGLIF